MTIKTRIRQIVSTRFDKSTEDYVDALLTAFREYVRGKKNKSDYERNDTLDEIDKELE